jgi:uncharacterized protein YecE (DUF72 family)
MNDKFHIGCSGYYYPAWKNKFYPQGLQPKKWLEYYSAKFNTVELNSTFYRNPKLSDLERYADSTPPDFSFSVKVSKYITHILKLKNSKTHIDEFRNLISEGLGAKLSFFLFQLPPSFHYTAENLKTVISNVPHAINSVVEFRHASWWNKEVEQEMKTAGITFCNVDFPGLKTQFQNTTTAFYLRLHGNPELFKSSYSEEELLNFYKKIPKTCKSCNVYFNNTYYEAGYTNASQLMKIISLKNN